MAIYEAECTRCGETFTPNDPSDLVHAVRADEVTECGGFGVLTGEWYQHQDVADQMLQHQLQPLVEITGGRWQDREAILLPPTPGTHEEQCYVMLCGSNLRVKVLKRYVRRL